MIKGAFSPEKIAAQGSRFRLPCTLYKKKIIYSQSTVFLQEYVSLVKNSLLKRDAYILMSKGKAL